MKHNQTLFEGNNQKKKIKNKKKKHVRGIGTQGLTQMLPQTSNLGWLL